MGKLDRVIMIACLVAGCSARSPDQLAPGASARGEPRRAKAALDQTLDQRLDGAGNLKPGPLRAVWLEIPAGFTERPGNSDRLSAFDSTGVPFAKVREYLQSRLVTDQVIYPADGVSFRHATATHTQLAMPPLDVMLMVTNREKNELRLIVEDLAPTTSEKPLSDSNAAQALAHDRGRVE